MTDGKDTLTISSFGFPEPKDDTSWCWDNEPKSVGLPLYFDLYLKGKFVATSPDINPCRDLLDHDEVRQHAGFKDKYGAAICFGSTVKFTPENRTTPVGPFVLEMRGCQMVLADHSNNSAFNFSETMNAAFESDVGRVLSLEVVP